MAEEGTKYAPKTVKDVDAQEFVVQYAKHLKGKVREEEKREEKKRRKQDPFFLLCSVSIPTSSLHPFFVSFAPSFSFFSFPLLAI